MKLLPNLLLLRMRRERHIHIRRSIIFILFHTLFPVSSLSFPTYQRRRCASHPCLAGQGAADQAASLIVGVVLGLASALFALLYAGHGAGD